MAILEAKNLSKTYHQGVLEVKALVDLTLAVESGEFIAVMGASGSGKSTLLNILGGLDEAESGELAIDGQTLGARRDSELTRLRRQRIGFIFQSYNLIPVLSALENVALPLLIDGVKAKEANSRAARLRVAPALKRE